MLYSSVNNPKIKELAKLKTKKNRDKQKTFLIEGAHLVKEAYTSGYLKELLLLEGTDFKLDVQTNYITENVLKLLSNVESPAGIIGVCEFKDMTLKGQKLLILDIYSDKVIRSSQGMIFKTNIVKRDLSEFLKEIKGKIPILGTKVTDGKDLKTLEKISDFAIIMGNEGNGVDPKLLDLCDEYLYIPMNKNCESLNVGVATSIILYELTK